MELTINQIKGRQKLLEKEVKFLLNSFNEQTGLTVTGSIQSGRTTDSECNIIFEYSNPFNKKN